MPAWVLLVTRNMLDLPRLEGDVRICGYSPRSAPDQVRIRVLLGHGEKPAAAVVDLVSTGEDGLAAVQELAAEIKVVAIAPTAPPDISSRAERFGALVVEESEARAFVPVLLNSISSQEDPSG